VDDAWQRGRRNRTQNRMLMAAAPRACPLCGEVHQTPLEACAWCLAEVTGEWIQMRRESHETQEEVTP